MRISRFAARAIAPFIGITFVALGLATAAQAQCPNFGAATNFAVGTTPLSVAVGDFNGDGTPDLAVANGNSNNVSILLGTGTGTFGAATNFGVGTGPFSVAIGEFNGDGRSDLAVANQNSNNVSILLGTETGTFGAATARSIGIEGATARTLLKDIFGKTHTRRQSELALMVASCAAAAATPPNGESAITNTPLFPQHFSKQISQVREKFL